MCINLVECVLFYFISKVSILQAMLVFSELNGCKTALGGRREAEPEQKEEG